jgi:SAM-dependent methyltransferase
MGMCYAVKNGVSFKQTLTVGRQNFSIIRRDADAILSKYDSSRFKEGIEIINGLYAKPELFSEKLFEYFGAEQTDSIDYSDYEGATIVHDMNIPVNDDLKNKYTVVWDGGSLEHVFNFPVAIKNCMDMVKPGGHFILETPANNYFGHGFYQFSPELFFSLLDKHNSFTDTKIFMWDSKFNWYEVVSPQIIKKRNILPPSNKASLMFVVSRKIANVPDVISAMQSDYVDRWNDTTHVGRKRTFVGCVYEKIKGYLPVKFCRYAERRNKFKQHFKLVKDFSIQHGTR